MKKVLLSMAFLALIAVSYATVVEVPNGSFEEPALTGVWNFYPYGTSETGLGTPGQWYRYTSAGYFVNTGAVGSVLTNCDGNQVAFLNSLPTQRLYMDTLHAVVNSDYELTVGVAARTGQTASTEGDTMLAIQLFTRSDEGAPVVIAETQVNFADLSDTMLTDYTVTLSADDAAAVAGKNLGIMFYSMDDNPGQAIDWTLDNVRLTNAVPEPATMLLLAAGGLVLRKKRS